MRLASVTSHVPATGGRRGDRRNRRSLFGSGALLRPSCPGENIHQMVVIHAARRGDDEQRWPIRLGVKRLQVFHTEGGYSLARSENRVAERVIPPDGLIVQFEDEIVGRILDHADLLEDN